MMNGKIKKAIAITLGALSILATTPVQATEITQLTDEPVVKVLDCNDLTLEMLTTRCTEEQHIMYIEKIVGVVTDDEGNGMVLNPPTDGGYYISYESVENVTKGDMIITYCVYNPYSNYDDDIIERWDFVE